MEIVIANVERIDHNNRIDGAVIVAIEFGEIHNGSKICQGFIKDQLVSNLNFLIVIIIGCILIVAAAVLGAEPAIEYGNVKVECLVAGNEEIIVNRIIRSIVTGEDLLDAVN